MNAGVHSPTLLSCTQRAMHACGHACVLMHDLPARGEGRGGEITEYAGWHWVVAASKSTCLPWAFASAPGRKM